LLPHVEKFNHIAKMDRFVKIAELLGENTAGLAPRDAAELALVAIKKLSADIGIPGGLIELGKRYGKDVKAEDIETMTINAQKDACGMTNPRIPKDDDVKAIYKAAL
jgi:alcohol dehydrogenase